MLKLLRRKKKPPKYISSEIRLSEQIDVQGTALYPAYVNDIKDHHYALFTKEELSSALHRGSSHKEESIPKTEYWVTKLIKLVLI